MEGLGYSPHLAYDHVLGANPDRPGGWHGTYTYPRPLPRAVCACSATGRRDHPELRPFAPESSSCPSARRRSSRSRRRRSMSSAQRTPAAGGRVSAGTRWSTRRLTRTSTRAGSGSRSRLALRGSCGLNRWSPTRTLAYHPRRRHQPAAGAAPDPDLVRRAVEAAVAPGCPPGRRLAAQLPQLCRRPFRAGHHPQDAGESRARSRGV